jgi:hypothetical protein
MPTQKITEREHTNLSVSKAWNYKILFEKTKQTNAFLLLDNFCSFGKQTESTASTQRLSWSAVKEKVKKRKKLNLLFSQNVPSL